jgi:hypothetical protein
MQHPELRLVLLVERLDDLLVRRGRDEAVADAAGELGRVRLRGGDEDGTPPSGMSKSCARSTV